MPASESLNSTYERFTDEERKRWAQGCPPDLLAEALGFGKRGSVDTRLENRPRTWVSVIRYPDGDVEISGCHIGYPSRKSRPPATREEKDRKADARARLKLRRVCKYFNLDYLWTFTYRGPVFERSKVLSDIDRFSRKICTIDLSFAGVFVLELHQGGGANHGEFHVHMAVAGFHDVKAVRSVWWSIVGEAQGNIEVKAPRGFSSGGCGRYISKYIGKDFGDAAPRQLGQHRYFNFRLASVRVEKMVFFKGHHRNRESALKAWLIIGSGKQIVSEWRSEDGGQFVFKTFR
jgi:hypothetical protein